MKKTVLFFLIVISIGLISEIAEARGRSGSRRVYSGHGKGSRYVGGK